MAIIYKITNTVNGKIYIGQTIHSLDKRFNGHKNESFRKRPTNQPLHNSIKKYGINSFICDCIEECSIESLDEREIYWIASLNATDKTIGYNLDAGGRKSNRIFTEEVKKRISLGLMIKHGNFTGETRKSIKKRNKVSNKIQIRCLNNGIIYDSITKAALELKMTVGNISDILHGRRKRFRGYIFEKIQ